MARQSTIDGGAVAFGGDDFADGRRRRDHEHHARVGDRADARDRLADGRRRPAARYSAAVHCRGGDFLSIRRGGRASLVGRGASMLVRELLNWPTEISLPAIWRQWSCRSRSGWCSATTRPGKPRDSTRSKRCDEYVSVRVDATGKQRLPVLGRYRMRWASVSAISCESHCM